MTVEFVPAGDATLWTTAAGSGPPLVLCHGGPGIWDSFDDLAPLIEERVAVHRYDQRACGRSGGSGPSTVDGFVEDLNQLRKHWSHERWIVAGHSWGASLALAYAVAHPERTRALVLIASTGIDRGWSDEYHERQRERLSDSQWQRMQELQPLRGTTRAIEDEFCALTWSTDFVDRETAIAEAQRTLRPDSRVNFAPNRTLNEDTGRHFAEASFRQAVAQLRIPTLLIHGEGDPRPAWPAERLATLLGGTFVTIPGAGHLPWIEQPDEVGTALGSFLDRLPAEAL